MIKVFDGGSTEFSGNGKGLFDVVESEVEVLKNGMYAATISIPMDRYGKWRRIKHDDIIMVDAPVKMFPEGDERPKPGENVVRSCPVYSNKNRTSSIIAYKYPIEVNDDTRILIKPSENIEFVYADSWYYNGLFRKIKLLDTGRILYTKSTGFDVVRIDEIAFTADEYYGTSATGVKPQPMRINSIEVDTSKMVVAIGTEHIFYDLGGDVYNNTSKTYSIPYLSTHSLNNSFGGKENCFKIKTRKRQQILSYINKVRENSFTESETRDIAFENYVSIFLDEEGSISTSRITFENEDGSSVRYEKMYIERDGFDIYLLSEDDVVINRNKVIRRKRDLNGVQVTTNTEGFFNRIVPIGVKAGANNQDLYLDEIYVDYPEESIHPYKRAVVWRTEEGALNSYAMNLRKTVLRDWAIDRLEKIYTEKLTYNMSIDFARLSGDDGTIRAGDFAGCISVTAIDDVLDLKTTVDVTRYTYDPIEHRFTTVEFGDLIDYYD